MTVKQVIAAARQSTPVERMGVMAAIDPAAAEAQLTDELASALDERIAAYRANPSADYTWEQVEAELDADG